MTVHEPVLLKEVLEYLQPSKNQDFIDCTLGGGGHAEAILERTGPAGRLLGFDLDDEAMKRVIERLAKFSTRTILINDNYTEIKKYGHFTLTQII